MATLDLIEVIVIISLGLIITFFGSKKGGWVFTMASAIFGIFIMIIIAASTGIVLTENGVTVDTLSPFPIFVLFALIMNVILPCYLLIKEKM